MPGSMWTLHCDGCDAEFEITTGATISLAPPADAWVAHGYEQYACRSCGILRSVFRREGATGRVRCTRCHRSMKPWEGLAGFPEHDPDDWPVNEVVEGPCPRCGGPLSAGMTGLWD
jgi:NAD-dependent SIR2 family protein deacetylase